MKEKGFNYNNNSSISDEAVASMLIPENKDKYAV